MAVAVTMDIPGGTQQMYDFVCQRMGFPDEWVPDGLISHTAGPTEDGWRVIDVWRSRAQFEAEIPPRVGPGIEVFSSDLGIEIEPPEIQFFELATVFSQEEKLISA